MAELFKTEFDLDTEYIKGDGGILEVKCDGATVWTNRDNRGYKPSDQEAREAMRLFLSRE